MTISTQPPKRKQDSTKTTSLISSKKARVRKTAEHESKESALPFLKSMGTNMVELYVGPEKQLFRIHKDALCRKVKFFDKIFNEPLRDVARNSAEFPDDDPATFDVLLEWVHTGKLRRITSEEKDTQNWDPYLLYFLCERLCFTKLMDQTMDIIRAADAERDYLPGPVAVHLVYSNTTCACSLRRYVASAFQFGIMEDHFPDRRLPKSAVQKAFRDHGEFASDFVNLLRADAYLPDPRTASNCEFHVHERDEPCPQGESDIY